jgi:hypothetical protein
MQIRQILPEIANEILMAWAISQNGHEFTNSFLALPQNGLISQVEILSHTLDNICEIPQHPVWPSELL